MAPVYVLCILGESPTILSNLLWWLASQEGRPIAGIEVWATGRGARHVADLVTMGGWQRLQAITGRLPALTQDVEPACTYGFRLHVHHCDGRPLDDVRSAEEAGAVNARLHDRVRTLRRKLPDDIQLVGCLAGGRKTVSAALQTAFCLQARPADRLVHVVFDAGLEAALRRERRMGEYVFPEPEWEALSGVAPPDQIVVYDVPYPRVRYLVPRRLSDALETEKWSDVWPTLEANMGRDAQAVLTRRGERSWTFHIVETGSDTNLFDEKLGQRAGALLAAMAEAPDGATAVDLIGWLDDHDVGWRPKDDRGADPETRAGAIRSAANKLRQELQGIPVGLERFGPRSSGFTVHSIHVDHQWP